ncbi:MAG TPA: hypothetical protein VNA69_14985 [Thermoanaerobaculia bacterium]|nr:hypothetical protein [Thermoanaerobaculia bacterium]
MSTRKKLSEEEIKRKLVADAENPTAWDPPITVPASRSPRPAWYGRTKHLELAAKFYVLSVLHRLGAEANLTYAQPDNVDIAAVRKSGEAFTIDVKTLTGKADWFIEPFSARRHHFLVFVRFQQDWHDPQTVPEVYIWSSEELRSFIAHRRGTTVSLEAVARKLDPRSAWDQFAAQPAA